MSEKPTDKARAHFNMAHGHAQSAHILSSKKINQIGMYDSHVAVSLGSIASGLDSVATGMRATYILLEEVKRLLEHQRRG